MSLPRLAIICDLVEENWPSMDLVAEMLLQRLASADRPVFEAVRVCPPLARRFTRLPALRRQKRVAFNADRLLNRLWDYPRHLRRQRNDFEFYHVCDHTYANVVHALPRGRTGVFCHDLDAFRSILHPDTEPRPRWFRTMARRVLSGLQRADVVFHTTTTVRAQILKHGLLDERRLVQAPYGISSEFTPDSSRDEPPPMPTAFREAPFLLHVGSCIPRKRIDIALRVFAEVRARHPGLRFVQAGGEWSLDHDALIARLGIRDTVLQLARLSRPSIASLYRRAAAVIMPSEAEGFGLPVVEALACGSPVIASDIPVFREVGADAVAYAKLADVEDWVAVVDRVLSDPDAEIGGQARLRQAARFSWKAHADTIAAAYATL